MACLCWVGDTKHNQAQETNKKREQKGALPGRKREMKWGMLVISHLTHPTSPNPPQTWNTTAHLFLKLFLPLPLIPYDTNQPARGFMSTNGDFRLGTRLAAPGAEQGPAAARVRLLYKHHLLHSPGVVPKSSTGDSLPSSLTFHLPFTK